MDFVDINGLTLVLIVFAAYMTAVCYFFNRIINNAFRLLDDILETFRLHIK